MPYYATMKISHSRVVPKVKTGLLLLLVLIIAGAIILAALPKGPRDLMDWVDPSGTSRTAVEADSFAAVTGTPWATKAAISVLESGGNAFDAAVAALLMLNVTAGEAASFPGIAPTLIYDARQDEIRSYVGAGTAPATATIERYRSEKHTNVPDFSILSQLIPASPDVIIALLKDYGTISFREAVTDAMELAREGFPITRTMQDNLDFSLIERIGFSIILPYNAEVYLKKEWWRPLNRGDRFTRPDLADTWQAMIEAESAAVESGADRREALLAVRSFFYEGPAAVAILKLHAEKEGLFSRSDLSSYHGLWEPPYQSSWEVRGETGHRYQIYTNRGWTQGIVVPMALNILEEIDLKALGHNSAEYIHTVVQALDLALSDREAYVGDPDFVDVPVDTLLSSEYAEQRRKMLRWKSFEGMPLPGEIEGYTPWISSETRETGTTALASLDFAVGRDTSQLVVADSAGNVVAITPSDFPKSPMVPGTGMNLGNRMVQFRLDQNSPTSLQPGKRPRVTPHAVMVYRDGQFWMAFNTPGGDMQTQALVQVLLNITVFGMEAQAALNAPRFRTRSVPSSFSPHEAEPGVLWLEKPLVEREKGALTERGYQITEKPEWDNEFGAVGAILKEQQRWIAVADPREATWAEGR